MENIEALLRKETAACRTPLSAEQTAQFQRYMELLLEWNTKLNLTAITEPMAFTEKHFLDSLWPLQWMQLAGKRCIDVGTGAGFPGLALKLAEPQLELTLLDSLQKRLTVLDDICGKLGVAAQTVHARAEEGGRKPELRQQFDFAFARAVAPLSVLCEYCLPFVKPGGYFCAWKGPAGQEELLAARYALQVLGGSICKNAVYTLPDGSSRTFLMIQHTRTCSPTYPRAGGKIKKQPLAFSTTKKQKNQGS